MRFFQLFIPLIEIVSIATIIYYLLSFFWNTRAMDLMVGLHAGNRFIFGEVDNSDRDARNCFGICNRLIYKKPNNDSC